MKHIWKTSRS